MAANVLVRSRLQGEGSSLERKRWTLPDRAPGIWRNVSCLAFVRVVLQACIVLV